MNIIKIPKDGASDDNVTIIELSKKNGDKVIKGEIIAEYETSKSIIELISNYNGFIYYLQKEGVKVDVSSPFCIILKSLCSEEEIQKIKSKLINTNEKLEDDKIISNKAKKLIIDNSIDVNIFEQNMITENLVISYLSNIDKKSFRDYKFKKNDIVIFGIGGHAGMCIDILIKNNNYKIVGFIDDKVKKDDVYGLEYLGNFKNLDQLIKHGLKNLIIGIGFINNLYKKDEIYKSLKGKINIPTIIHNTAIVENSSKIGDGCQIFAGSIIGSNVKINDNCIINSGAIISHNTIVDRTSHITPGATIAGHVKIGKRSLIGMCATIFINVTIGDDSVVKNNQNITSDIKGI